MKLFNLTAAAVAIGVVDAQDGFTERELELNQRSIDMGDGRAAKFKESDGYIVIEKNENCWEACGGKRGWSGFCSFCSLSNGSPGFCCNPRSAGGGRPLSVDDPTPVRQQSESIMGQDFTQHSKIKSAGGSPKGPVTWSYGRVRM